MSQEFVARNGIISKGNVLVTGSLTTSGSLTATGTITATTLVVQTVTSSISSITGSTNFGSLSSNTHTFTGSIVTSGSATFGSSVTAGGSITTTLSQATSTDINVTNTSTANGAMAQVSAINGGASQIDMVAFGSGSTGTLYGITKSNLKVIRDNSLAAQSNGLAVGTDAAVPLYMFTNSSPRMTISSGGSVTFTGTVIGNDNISAYAGFRNYTGGVARGGMYTYATITGAGSDYSTTLFSETGQGMYFCINGSVTKVISITSGGYTKISNNGTYTNIAGPYHEMYTNYTNNEVVVFRNSSASPYGYTLQFSGASPNGGSNWFMYCEDSTAQRFSVRSNGGIYNYSANNSNLSDIRLKKDISPLESYWDKFKTIEIVKFKYIDQSHDDYNIGVIAQQVEEVAPEFVDADGWNDKNTPEDGIPIKSVYESDLHHATIKVLQEAMAKIEQLEAKVIELENK